MLPIGLRTPRFGRIHLSALRFASGLTVSAVEAQIAPLSGKRAGSSPRQAFAAMPFSHSSVANPNFAISRGKVGSEFRILSHTSNSLNLVWFSDLKFLYVNAMKILGTSNPTH